MSKKISGNLWLVAFFLFVSCSLDIKKLENSKHEDFSSMASAYKEGRDYSVELYDRNMPCSVFAIHAGELEEMTASIARRLADEDMNLYIFNAWGENKKNLHLTSAKFNDGRAVSLSLKSVAAVSVHAMADKKDIVCIGGLNEDMAKDMAQGFVRAGFKVETPCKRLPGRHKDNIVNLPQKKGVQLEISVKLIKKLDKQPAKLLKFIEAARASIRDACYTR